MARVYTEHWEDYELIDAGGDRKLERWGKIITIRPERNAYFRPAMSLDQWRKRAHFEFIEKTSTKGDWKQLKEGTPREWQIHQDGAVFNLRLTQFKHLGIFPEQRFNWDFIRENVVEGDSFLNLFGYTGGASLAAQSKGATVFHCDAVRQINGWAKQNMESSGLSDIRWVLEDALKFAEREVKRGKKYTGIIMDPPAYGIGAKKERWKIEERFPRLMAAASDLCAPDGFIIANTYSPRLKEDEIKRTCNALFSNKEVSVSTLCIKSSSGKRIEYGQLTRISKVD